MANLAAPVLSKFGQLRVYVTFIGTRPSDKDLDRVLHVCMSAAVKRDGTKDIIVSPWLRKHVGDNPYDE